MGGKQRGDDMAYKYYRKYKDGERYSEIKEEVASEKLSSYYKDALKTLQEAGELQTSFAYYKAVAVTA